VTAAKKKQPVPPLGAEVQGYVEPREGARLGTRYLARARWTHPVTHKRESASVTFGSQEEAEAWIDAQKVIARTGQNPGQTLEDYITGLGERWARSIDRTSTYDPYAAGLKLRVIPELGHIPVGMITAGLIDRAIDRWETSAGHSTVKNTVAALVHVLDDAVRDGLLARNPAKDRARRKQPGQVKDGSDVNPRELALPDVATLNKLVDAVVDAGGHQCWGDMVLLLATTGMRISEVSGLVIGDVDLKAGLIYVRRQRYPGRGGLIIKPTKGRRNRVVPIIGPGRETLERLTAGGRSDAPVLVGPRGGTITTATLRDATDWDKLVRGLGIAGLVRHGLRHTALTWMADSGVALHVLQRVAGHQDPAMTARYLHPDHRALTDAGEAFGAWWTQNGHKNGREEGGEDAAETA
jgi:integrase